MRKIKLIKKFKSLTTKIGILAILLSTIPHDGDKKNNPNVHLSKTKIEFVKKFNILLNGPKNLIENDLERISDLAYVIEKENYTKKFKLNKIIITDQAPFNSRGYYTIFPNNIYLKDNDNGVTHHEITHDKTTNTLLKHPTFINIWKKITNLGNNSNQYLGKKWDKNNFTKKDSLNGFISRYSRRNSLEDIAVLCSKINEYPLFFTNYKYKEKINEKAKLAQNVELIPKDFLERLTLDSLYQETLSTKKYNKYINETKKFLNKNSNSIYKCELLYTLANINDNTQDKDPVKMYKKVLTAKFKDKTSYKSALNKLAKLDLKNSHIYDNAILEYKTRRENGNLELASIGVNDYLILYGIELK